MHTLITSTHPHTHTHTHISPSPPLPHTHTHTDTNGRVNKVEARLDLDNKDYKNTQKLTWLSEADSAPLTPTVCVHFDHLITKGVLKPEEDFRDFVNWNSKV